MTKTARGRANAATKAPLEIGHRWLTKWREAVYRMGDNRQAKEAYKRLQPINTGDHRLDMLVLELARKILEREASDRPEAFRSSPFAQFEVKQSAR